MFVLVGILWCDTVLRARNHEVSKYIALTTVAATGMHILCSGYLLRYETVDRSD